MHFTAIAASDIGNVKSTNQDSVLIEHASTPANEVLMAIICDGMGGLAKGELASATVIRAFKEWFDKILPIELAEPNMQVIAEKWKLLLKELNVKIMNYGSNNGVNLGTTFTGMLFVGEEYIILHVGDSRAYAIINGVRQLTEDQTYVQREIKLGNMTPEQARVDPKRNMLLQCVGASPNLEPVILCGKAERGTYMLCSDGFRHELSPQELLDAFHPSRLGDKAAMFNTCCRMIDIVKGRRERDNISVLLVKAE